MSSYQQQSLTIHANLIAELRELKRLRERVKNAELLFRTSRRKWTLCGRRSRRQFASATSYRLRLPLRR
jgi:hypothetical protein